MGRKPSVFVRELTKSEKQKLTSLQRERDIDYSLKQKVDIILLSSEGCEVKSIASRVGRDQSNVNKWINRFNKGGIDALVDIPKTGRTKEITEDIELKIAAIALADPKDYHKAFTTWTVETIRQEAINSGVIATISWETTRKALKNCGITPRRSCTWKENKDPDYKSKKKTS